VLFANPFVAVVEQSCEGHNCYWTRFITTAVRRFREIWEQPAGAFPAMNYLVNREVREREKSNQESDQNSQEDHSYFTNVKQLWLALLCEGS
jgi:hypothetical protein